MRVPPNTRTDGTLTDGNCRGPKAPKAMIAEFCQAVGFDLPAPGTMLDLVRFGYLLPLRIVFRKGWEPGLHR